MPRSSEKNELVREERKQQILKAALSVYIRCGFFGTDMDEVAREAQLAKGLVYYYYKTKKDLFQSLFSWMFEEGDTVSNRLIEQTKELEPVEQLMYYTYGMFQENKKKPGMMQFFLRAPFDAYAVFEPNNWDKGASQSNSHFKAITKMIKSGIQKGVIPNVNPGSAANSYWSVFVANLFHYEALIEGKKEKENSTIDLFEDVIRFCFQGLGVESGHWNQCMNHIKNGGGIH